MFNDIDYYLICLYKMFLFSFVQWSTQNMTVLIITVINGIKACPLTVSVTTKSVVTTNQLFVIF